MEEKHKHSRYRLTKDVSLQSSFSRQAIDYGEIDNIFLSQTYLEDCCQLNVNRSDDLDLIQHSSDFTKFSLESMSAINKTTKKNSVFSRLGHKIRVNDNKSKCLNNSLKTNQNQLNPETNLSDTRKETDTLYNRKEINTSSASPSHGNLYGDDKNDFSCKRRNDFIENRGESTKKLRSYDDYNTPKEGTPSSKDCSGKGCINSKNNVPHSFLRHGRQSHKDRGKEEKARSHHRERSKSQNRTFFETQRIGRTQLRLSNAQNRTRSRSISRNRRRSYSRNRKRTYPRFNSQDRRHSISQKRRRFDIRERSRSNSRYRRCFNSSNRRRSYSREKKPFPSQTQYDNKGASSMGIEDAHIGASKRQGPSYPKDRSKNEANLSDVQNETNILYSREGINTSYGCASSDHFYLKREDSRDLSTHSSISHVHVKARDDNCQRQTPTIPQWSNNNTSIQLNEGSTFVRSQNRHSNKLPRRRGDQRNGLQTAEERMNLQLLDQMDPDGLVVYLNAYNDDLDTFLWKENAIPNLPLFLQIMKKVCNHKSESLVDKALKPFIDRKTFFARNDVQELIANMRFQFKNEDIQITINLLELMKRLFTRSSKCQTNVLLLLDSLERNIEENIIDDTIKGEIIQLIASIRNKRFEKQETKRSSNPTLTILPTLQEIDCFEHLQVENSGQNEIVYLKRLFQVYRQDFIKPLCIGLKQLKNDITADPSCLQRRWRNDNIRVFKNVQFIVRCCNGQDGITWQIYFDIAQYRNVNLKIRKILMYGSLVCLVNTDFTCMQYATVSCRDQLEKGILDIRIDVDNKTTENIFEQSEILLVESQAFYQTYYHTLNSIKEMFEEVKQESSALPFGKQLLSVSGKQEMPDYFKTDIFKNKGFDVRCLCEFDEKSIDISKEGNWPDPSLLGLDVSQYEALITSMKSKIALIQGPPGTGKTVVGLKIAELFLRNESIWRERTEENKKGPILLLSYTNHALDQFLLDILERFPGQQENNFVRLGSRSEVKELMEINLAYKRRTCYTYKTVTCKNRHGHTYFKTKREVENETNITAAKERTKLRTRINEHDKLKKMRQELYTGIVDCNWLYRIAAVVSDTHYNQLIQKGSFSKWLQLTTTEFHHNEPKEDIDDDDLYEYIDDDANYNPQSDDSDFEDRTNENNLREKLLGRHLDPEHLVMEVPADLKKHLKENKGNRTYFWNHLNDNQKIFLGNFIRDTIYKTVAMQSEELSIVKNVWDLSLEDRWRLYKYWIKKALMPIDTEIYKCEESFENAQKRFLEVQRIADAKILQQAKLIACTTTRAARDIEILRKISPSIILIEEAAEIPEHHVIASLTSSCQQLIMIGDHQQLRPSYNDYETAKKHKLDISLFERLIKNNFPFRRLKYQHRMKPCFSRLLVPHIYKTLFDDESVFGRSHVKGMNSDLFFISHCVYEDSDREELSRSHKNSHEANYIAYLYKYIRLQGYSASQITILSTYLDQVRLLRSTISPIEESLITSNYSDYRINPQHNGNKQVRITAVDNFQGEENDIILLSLVRSNEGCSIGYLWEANRICVALSRAKIGLYVIGNFDQLAAKSSVWENIIKDAKAIGYVGKSISLSCQNHKAITTINNLADFELVKDGGCNQPCKFKRICGHYCLRKCHSSDKDHNEACTKMCMESCKDGRHECSTICHYPYKCQPCKQMVDKQIPLCKHIVNMPCHLDPEHARCNHKCNMTISCGHQCQRKCSLPCTPEEECNELIKTNALCGHEVQVACHTKYNPPCRIKCDAELKCGHKCKGTCSECSQGRLHIPCQEKCKRVLVCGHMCTRKCNMKCPPCDKKCDRKCSHYSNMECKEDCEKLCRDSCIKCREKCQWQCGKHCPNNLKCDRLCYQPCTRPKCNEPCSRNLDCGHKCSGLRCEGCSKLLCKSCNTSLTQIIFGHEDEDDATFIKLEDCNCTFEVRDMDKYVEITLKSIQEDDIRPLKCPRCTVTITKSMRYTNELKIVNKLIEEVYQTIVEKEGVCVSSRRKQLKCHMIKSDIVEDREKLIKEIDRIKSIEELGRATDKFQFLSEIAHLKVKTKQLPMVSRSINARIKQMENWVGLRRYAYSDQEIAEFVLETRRSHLMIDILSMQDKVMRLNDENIQLPEIIFQHLKNLQSVIKIGHEEISHLRKETDEISTRILGLTIEEKKMIKRAMEAEFRGSGHWYRCVNGHIYSIGECGMPMEQRKCPVCDCTIGGQGHLLNNDNDRDQEMETL